MVREGVGLPHLDDSSSNSSSSSFHRTNTNSNKNNSNSSKVNNSNIKVNSCNSKLIPQNLSTWLMGGSITLVSSVANGLPHPRKLSVMKGLTLVKDPMNARIVLSLSISGRY